MYGGDQVYITLEENIFYLPVIGFYLTKCSRYLCAL